MIWMVQVHILVGTGVGIEEKKDVDFIHRKVNHCHCIHQFITAAFNMQRPIVRCGQVGLGGPGWIPKV